MRKTINLPREVMNNALEELTSRDTIIHSTDSHSAAEEGQVAPSDLMPANDHAFKESTFELLPQLRNK